ncbi:kinase-like domain-containing protein [Sordaria brevicollis]|uniref:EKC/KEOPS complex subunit BUD32 n=1 Tax=Sordaria brevicollis TaxID=83679 RepID=A0AAE0PKK6_SORBR|nr:kinase-like domain-containing protein [Sordaria brevicollis]
MASQGLRDPSPPGFESPPCRDPLFSPQAIQYDAPASHPDLIFRLRTCYGAENPSRDLYENNKSFCTIDRHEILIDVGYHVRRPAAAPPYSPHAVATVGSDGDIWLPTVIPQLFEVFLGPQSTIPVIHVHSDAPKGSIFISAHEHDSGGIVAPASPGRYIEADEVIGLTPGRGYTLMVNTEVDNKKVVYPFEVEWEDTPLRNLQTLIRMAAASNSQSLKPRYAAIQRHPVTGEPIWRPHLDFWDSYQGSSMVYLGMEAQVKKGTLKLCDNQSVIPIAIKRFSSHSTWVNRRAALTEIKRLALIQHDFIVEYLGHYSLLGVHEVCFGWMDGSLEGLEFDITGPLSTTDTWSTLLLQMSMALAYLKTMNIVHEDVRPGNILYKFPPGGHLYFRLADFSNSGRSWACFDFRARQMARAPEWTNLIQENDGGTRPSADVWALGMTMLAVTKRPNDTQVPEIWNKMGQGLFSEAVEEAFHKVSNDVSHVEVLKLSLLWFLLRIDPFERATAEGMVRCIQNLMRHTHEKQTAAVARQAKITYQMRERLGIPSVNTGEPEGVGLLVPLPRVDSSPSEKEAESPHEDPGVFDIEMGDADAEKEPSNVNVSAIDEENDADVESE